MAKTMDNISLAEAVADAKAVINGATVNAKLALEEALTPRIKSILYTKLAEDLEEETEESIEEELTNEVEFTDEDEEIVDESESSEIEENDENEMDEEISLEDILRELELEEEQVEEETEIVDEEYDEEEDEINEILASLEGTNLDEWVPGEKNSSVKSSIIDYLKFERKRNDNEEVVDEEIELELDEEEEEDVDLDDLMNEYNKEKENRMKKEYATKIAELNKNLNEAKKSLANTESKLREMNLLNAKLLYSNKLLQEHSLTKEEKDKMLSKMDRAKNVNEVKLVFEVLNENYTSNNQNIQENFRGFASRSVSSTLPASVNTNSILNESMAERFRKLANIK
jgi:hypothetical protein